MLVDHLQKTKKQYHNLKKQEIPDIFIKTNCGDFEDLIKKTDSDRYCVIKHLIFPNIQNMMDINVELLQWSINFLVKKTSD